MGESHANTIDSDDPFAFSVFQPLDDVLGIGADDAGDQSHGRSRCARGYEQRVGDAVIEAAEPDAYQLGKRIGQ